MLDTKVLEFFFNFQNFLWHFNEKGKIIYYLVLSSSLQLYNSITPWERIF